MNGNHRTDRTPRGNVARKDAAGKAGGQMQLGSSPNAPKLSIRTRRHYDDVGLVTPSARSAGGFRLYTETDVDRLTTIRRMKPLGLTLEEMAGLLNSLDILEDPDASTADREVATGVVLDCYTHTEHSCRSMRRQLDYAEEFKQLLATKTDS